MGAAAARRAAVRSDGWPCSCSSCRSAQLLKNASQFLLQRSEIPVIADNVVGACSLLVLGELTRVALVDRRVPPGRRALRADALVCGHYKGSVVEALEPRLEQQRRLDDERPRRRRQRALLRAPGGHLLGDARPQHALQPGALA